MSDINIKLCKYRNCYKDISNMRVNTLYCCRRHKEIEYLYRKREKFRKGRADNNI